MKKFFILFLAIVALFSFSFNVVAQETMTITLGWDADLSVIEPDLQDYNIYYKLDADTGFTFHDTVRIDRSSTETRMTSQVPLTVPTGYEGNICFYVTAVDTSQNESKPSEEVCVRYDKTPPAPPSGVIVDITVVEAIQ